MGTTTGGAVGLAGARAMVGVAVGPSVPPKQLTIRPSVRAATNVSEMALHGCSSEERLIRGSRKLQWLRRSFLFIAYTPPVR